MSENKYFQRLIVLLSIKFFIFLLLIRFSGIDLFPDEAQYWTWSQSLDWGYYSKPFGIALEIWLGCKLFGNNLLGIRFFAVVIGILLPLATYLLSRRCGCNQKISFWAGVIAAITPFGSLVSFVATTDGPYLLFWTIACADFVGSISNKTKPNFFRIGAWILFGSIFKWPIYILWLFIYVFTILFPYMRSKKIFIGMFISLLGLIPSIVWNHKHNWETFKHVGATISHATRSGYITQSSSNGNLVDFFSAQAALISPLFFILLLIALVVIGKKKREVPLSILFCSVVTVTIFLIYLIMSIFNKIQANWALHAYPTAIVLLSWYTCTQLKQNKKLLFVGSAISILMVTGAFAVTQIQNHSILCSIQAPYKLNPFQHALGWSKLRKTIEQIEYNPKKHFLAAHYYQTSSLLSFYSPGQKRAYFINLGARNKNQFSVWPSMKDEQIGKDGFFVLVVNNDKIMKSQQEYINRYTKDIAPYFENIQAASVVSLFDAYKRPSKCAIIFKCENYNGKLPQISHNY